MRRCLDFFPLEVVVRLVKNSWLGLYLIRFSWLTCLFFLNLRWLGLLGLGIVIAAGIGERFDVGLVRLLIFLLAQFYSFFNETHFFVFGFLFFFIKFHRFLDGFLHHLLLLLLVGLLCNPDCFSQGLVLD